MCLHGKNNGWTYLGRNIYVHTYIYIHKNPYIHIHIHIHIHTLLHVHIHIHIHIHILILKHTTTRQVYTRHSQALEIPVPLDGAPQDWDRRDGFGEQEFVDAAAASPSKQGGREKGGGGGGAVREGVTCLAVEHILKSTLVVTLCNQYTRGVDF